MTQASGSDDKYIFVYRYSTLPVNTFGNTSKTPLSKENWQRCYTLQGHTMDILDLDWSCDGILASGSIDNQVMVWDLGLNEQPSIFQQSQNKNSNVSSIISPSKMLHGHQSFVKGVSFDPMLRYVESG